MRKGLVKGMTATVSTVVTPAMTATLAGRPIHPVLATARLIEWMEWAGRKLILPYLEPSEDAVGYHIDVVHLRPLPVGETFTATAEFLELEGNRIVAAVYADSTLGRIGQGRFVQVLMSKRALYDRIGQSPEP